MKQRRHSLPQPLMWLVVAVLSIVLTLALVAQLPRSERSADDSFGTTIVLQKKVYDDADRSDNPEKSPDDAAGISFDVLLVSPVYVFVGLTLAFSTTRHLAASYLVSFISASPRAPPALSSN